MGAKMVLKPEEITKRLFQAARQILPQADWARILPSGLSDEDRADIVQAAMLDPLNTGGVFEPVEVTTDHWVACCNLLNHYAGVRCEAEYRPSYRRRYEERGPYNRGQGYGRRY